MKKPKLILILFLFSVITCIGQETKNSETIKTPTSFKMLYQAEGDLDKDGIPEKVVIYDTQKLTDFGTERQIYIYKKEC